VANLSYLLLAIVAGAGLAFQAVINTRLSQGLNSPLWASCVQVFVGLVFLAVCLAIAREPMPAFVGASRLPWWAWTGGAIGAAYVLSVIVTTRPLGVAVMVAAVVVGQSVAALLIDHYGWFGVDTHRLSPMRVVGVLLLFAGVLLIRSR
jgi:transporter family-2 protein